MINPAEIAPRMREVLNSLSDDARKAALKRCKELDLDPNKGEIPLEESLINLDFGSKTLADSIEKGKIILVPLSLQRALLAKIEAVAETLARLNSGSDEVVNLVTAIEDFNASVWSYGLHNLSGEVLGYQAKMNQLKNEETLIHQLRDQLEAGVILKGELENLLAAMKGANAEIELSSAAAKEASAKAGEKLQEITSVSQNATALASTTQQNETTSTQQVSIAKASAAEVQAIESKIKEFYAEIDGYKKKIDETSDEARTNVVTNRKETSDLVAKLNELENQIKDKIEKATGFSLFHSFQTRQGNIQWAKRFWGIALAVVVAISLSLTAYIAHSTTDFNIGFYLKLSMSLPLIYAISFCTIQYSRERRLEEEYAFKSAISISLDPYQSLVSRLVDKTQPEELKKFTAFVLDAIQKVFTSPTEKIFQAKEKNGPLSEKSIKKLAEIVGNLARAVKP
jgi:hypothetical protein